MMAPSKINLEKPDIGPKNVFFVLIDVLSRQCWPRQSIFQDLGSSRVSKWSDHGSGL